MTAGLLLLGLIILILLFYLVGSVAPTVTQFFLAYFAAKRLANGRRWQVISYVVVILIFFTLVLRAGSLLPDLYFKLTDSKRQIYRQLVLNEGDRVAVDINAVFVEYKPEYAKAPTMGGNAGMGFRWEGVSLRGDYFGNTLADTGLTLDTSTVQDQSIPKIEIQIAPNPSVDGVYYLDAQVKISDQHGLAAEYVTRIRRRFSGEPDDRKERRSGGQGSWLIPFLFHSTPVNRYLVQPLASWIGLDNPEPPISHFLNEAIQVLPPKKTAQDAKITAELVGSVEKAIAKWQGRLKLDPTRSPIISCTNNTLRAEGLNPLTIWNHDGTMRRVHLARKEIFAPRASLVVCGTAGYSVVAKGLLDGHAWIYKYDHDWNLLGRVELINLVLWKKIVTQFKEEDQYYKLEMYDEVGSLLTYLIPKSEGTGFADRFAEGYIYNPPDEYSEYYHPRPHGSLEGFLLKQIKK